MASNTNKKGSVFSRIECELEKKVGGTEGQTMNASCRKALGHSCRGGSLN